MDYSGEHQGRSSRVPWVIKRFIDHEAEFMFVPEGELMAAAKREDATPFDARRRAARAGAGVRGPGSL